MFLHRRDGYRSIGLAARRLMRLLLLLSVCAGAVSAWAASTATTTTLTTSKKTVNGRQIFVMVAKVTPTAVTQGLVRFYDGSTLLGTAQIVNTGTKYPVGTANLSVEMYPGSHSLKAVFAGTGDYAESSSTVAAVAANAGTATTTITSSGSVGNYTLTGTVTAIGIKPPTGQVDFENQTQGNVSIGAAALGAATLKRDFATAVNYPIYNAPTMHSPQDAAVVDVNGDGILDLVVLDSTDGLSILLGKGDGTFLAATPFCTYGTPPKPCLIGSGPHTVATGDFNSDGIPDFVVSSNYMVQTAIGIGDGTFQQAVRYDVAMSGTEVKVADVNLDGTPDLVVSVTRGVSVLLGNGDGTFQPHNETGLNDASTYITIGDFNHDEIPDVAAAGWNGSHLMVLLGNGNGTFQSEIDTDLGMNTAGCHVLAADLKGTGYAGDIAACGGGGKLETLIGHGDGTFAAPVMMPVNGTFTERIAGLAGVDVNGDDGADLALTWYASDTDTGRVALFTNKKDGTGAFNPTPVNKYVGHHPIAIATGDFDADGTVDLAVPNSVDNNTSMLLNKASQTASAVLANVAVPGTGTQNVFAKYMGDTKYGSSSSSTIPLTGSGGTTSVTISSISPSSAVAGSAAFTLTVNGTGFAAGSVVQWGGSARTTTFVSATKVTASIAAADVAVAGSKAVTVKVGTMVSNSADFTVTAPPAKPTVTSISPNYAYRNAAALTMTVTGTSFTSGSIVYWGSAQLSTTFVSATKLTAAVPAANLTTLGTFQVTVGTGAVMSNAMPFTVSPYTRLPLAYGFFNKDGTAGSTSGNLTCKWITTNYQCTLTGETVTSGKYVVNATVGESDTPAFIGVGTLTGKIVVSIFNMGGTGIQQPFNLVVFKP